MPRNPLLTLPGLFKTAHIYRHVQEFLVKNDTEFLVAPYSACAQVRLLHTENLLRLTNT